MPLFIKKNIFKLCIKSTLNKLLYCENKNEIKDSLKNKQNIDVFLRLFNPKILEKKKLKIEESSEDEKEPVKKQKNKKKLTIIE